MITHSLNFLRLCGVFILTAFSLPRSLPAAAQQSRHTHQASVDKPAVHGMFICGNPRMGGNVYASHLPMFRSPHNYQVLVELDISDFGRKIFAKSLKNFPLESTYTLAPEEFVLPEMMHNPRPFKARLYRGHFERGGKPIGDTLLVKITRVIYFKQLPPQAPHADTARLVVFGAGTMPTRKLAALYNTGASRSTRSSQRSRVSPAKAANEREERVYFAAHILSGKPDFDQILVLKPAVKTTTLSQLPIDKPFALTIANSNNNQGWNTGTTLKAFSNPQDNEVVPTSWIVLKSLYLEYSDVSQ
jgi:hypothetical protein